MESEHLQTLFDCKQIFELSQSRGCWKLEEAKNVVTLYERLCDIIQHYEKSKELNTIQETKKEEIKESEEMDNVD